MPRRKYPIFHENDLITEGVMWVDIPDFEDYIISELGEVISKQRMIACKNGINRMKSATKINPLKKKKCVPSSHLKFHPHFRYIYLPSFPLGNTTLKCLHFQNTSRKWTKS